MKLYNTLKRKKEDFIPVNKDSVLMYNCGPTVYWDVHTGNLRAYTAWDVLARYLRWKKYNVSRIINFTDIGHMSGDEDFGDDKIERTAKEKQVTPKDIASMYIVKIIRDFFLMNIQFPNGGNAEEVLGKISASYDENIKKYIDIIKSFDREKWASYGFAPATEYIAEMIEVIEKIEDNGFAYETDQAVYFDTSKYKDYWKMAGQKMIDKTVAFREEVCEDKNKKNPADFVLWMKATGRYANHIMKWGAQAEEAPLKSRWGVGFPGWHIECTAMANKLLGEKFDIHTGGTDHIAVHHTNEIAQNYGAFGHIGANYWLHNEMIVDKEGQKASKSKKNVYFLDEIIEKGYDPMDLRYYFLTVNYRKPIKFSFEGLEGAKNSRIKIIKAVAKILNEKNIDAVNINVHLNKDDGQESVLKNYYKEFEAFMDDNLNSSGALSVLNKIFSLDNDNSSSVDEIIKIVKSFDYVFGLKIIESAIEYNKKNSESNEIPSEIVELLEKRNSLKKERKFKEADEIRLQLKEMDWEIEDYYDEKKELKSKIKKVL